MFIYLASPYNHADPSVMESRRVAACRKAGELIAGGLAVFSPIAHNVAVIRESGVETGWARWQHQDSVLLAACSKVVVLMLAGWRESRGVAAEIALAAKLGKPVEYVAL